MWIDLEHGALASADVQALAIAARAGGAASLVRVRHAHDRAIGAALDAGADGIVVPRLEGVDDAACVVERLSYPPVGSRGFAARRGSDYGRDTRGCARARSAWSRWSPRRPSRMRTRSQRWTAWTRSWWAVPTWRSPLAATRTLRSAGFREAVMHVQQAADAAGIPSGIAGPDDPALLAELAGGRSTVLVLAADVRIYARALATGTQKLRRELALGAPEREESHVGT